MADRLWCRRPRGSSELRSLANSPPCACIPSTRPALSIHSLPLPSSSLSAPVCLSGVPVPWRSFQPAVAAPTDGLRPSFVGARLGPAAPPPPPAARPSARPMAEPTALQSRPRSRTEPRRRAGRCPRPPPVNAGAGRGHHLGRASLPSCTSKPRPAAVPFPKHGRLPCLSLCLQEEDPLLSLSLYDRWSKKKGTHGPTWQWRWMMVWVQIRVYLA